MVGWHHQLDGYEFEQIPGVGNWQGSLVSAIHGVAENWTRLSDWTELLLREDMQAIEKTKQNIFLNGHNEDYKGKQKNLIYL